MKRVINIDDLEFHEHEHGQSFKASGAQVSGEVGAVHADAAAKVCRQHHTRPRRPERWMQVQCRNCGDTFERRIVEVQRHPNTYCSRECYRAGC